MSNTIQIRDNQGQAVYPITDESLVIGLNERFQQMTNRSYTITWDGTAAPTVANIPAGVVVTYNGTNYTGTLAASENTFNYIYLVKNGNNYDQYVTSSGAGTYTWVFMGTTEIDLSDYATKNEINQLGQKVNGDITKEISWSNGYIQASTGVVKPSTASRFSQPFLLKAGEKVTVGTKNSNIGIICSTNADSVAVGDTVTVIKTTSSSEQFETYEYTAATDIKIVVCVLASNYNLSFYDNNNLTEKVGNAVTKQELLGQIPFEKIRHTIGGTTEASDGNRYSLLFNVTAGMQVTYQCEWQDGVFGGIWEDRRKALLGANANCLQSLSSYTKEVVSVIITQSGILRIGVKKTDDTTFTTEDIANFNDNIIFSVANLDAYSSKLTHKIVVDLPEIYKNIESEIGDSSRFASVVPITKELSFYNGYIKRADKTVVASSASKTSQPFVLHQGEAVKLGTKSDYFYAIAKYDSLQEVQIGDVLDSVVPIWSMPENNPSYLEYLWVAPEDTIISVTYKDTETHKIEFYRYSPGYNSIVEELDSIYSKINRNPLFDNIQLIGHGADKINAPQQTIPAIQSALDTLKIKWMEFDPKVTSDGYIVFSHDDSISAMTGLTGNISSMTLSQLKELDWCAPSRFGDRFSGTKILELSELLSIAHKNDCIIEIDCTNYSLSKTQMNQVITIAIQYGILDRIIFECNTQTQIDNLLDLNSDTNVMWISANKDATLPETLKKFRMAVVGLNYIKLSSDPDIARAVASRIHNMGYKIASSIINPTPSDKISLMNSFFSAGIDYMYSEGIYTSEINRFNP